MKKNSLRFILSLLFLGSLLQSTYSQTVSWTKEYDGTAKDDDFAKSMVMDKNGNIYVTGSSLGDSGENNYVTIKYNSSGVQQWASVYYGSGDWDDFAAAIAIDAKGNVFVTGSVSGSASTNFGTIKYNNSGVLQWAKEYDGSAEDEDAAVAMAIDTAGNVYVVGYSADTSGTLNFATVKYDNSGAFQWAKEYDGSGNGDDQPAGIAVDIAGNVYVGGYGESSAGNIDYITIKYNKSGTRQWVKEYNGGGDDDDFCTAITLDAGDNIIITGGAVSAGGTYDMVTVKYNSAGSLQWTKELDGAGKDLDYALAIVSDTASNIYITGANTTASGTTNFATVKYNKSGSLQWSKDFNGAGNDDDEANAIALDPAGNVYVTGYTTISTGANYGTVKYNNSGTQQWSKEYDGTANSDDQPSKILADASGSVYVTGSATSSSGSVNYVTIKYCTAPANAGTISGPKTVCTGQSGVVYSVSSIGNATDYIWTLPTGATITSGNNTRTITVSFGSNPTTGNITVQGSNSCGKGNVSTLAVTVGKLQVISFKGFKDLCINAGIVNLTTLSNATPFTGKWQVIDSAGVTNSKAELQVGLDANNGDTLDTRKLNPQKGPGLYKLRYSDGAGICYSKRDTLLRIHSLPTVTVGLSNNGSSGKFCESAAGITLIANPSGGTWTSSVSGIISGGKFLPGNVTSGNKDKWLSLTYTYTHPTTKCDTSKSIPVYVQSKEAVSITTADYDTCYSNSLQFKLQASSAFTNKITWSHNAGVTKGSFDNNIQISTNNPATFKLFPRADSITYVIIKVETGGLICPSVIDNLTIKVNPLPAKPVISKTGTLLTSTTASTYQWYMNGTKINGAASKTYSATANGNYTVVVTNNGKCSNSSDVLNVIIGSVKNTKANHGVIIYPNPSTGKFTIELKTFEKAEIEITNSTGGVLFNAPLESSKTEINLIDRSKGIYFYKIRSAGSIMSRGILVVE